MTTGRGGLLGGLLGRLGGSREKLPSFTIQLPDGWLGRPLTKRGCQELAATVEGRWPELAASLRLPRSEMPLAPEAVFAAVDLRANAGDAKPTLLHVAEYAALDLDCEMRQMRANLEQSDDPPTLEYLELPAGTAGRLIRVWSGGGHLPGAARSWAEGLFVIFRIHVGGVSYEAQFESPADARADSILLFNKIMYSFAPGPGWMAAGAEQLIPHQAPDLEALIPSEILGRPICKYSVTASNGRADSPQLEVEGGIAAELGLRPESVQLAGASTFNPESDPPFHFTVARFPGAREADLVGVFGPDGPDGWALVGERTVAGRRTYLLTEEAMPGMPGGRTYLYLVGDTRWFVSSGIDAWLEGFFQALPRQSTT